MLFLKKYFMNFKKYLPEERIIKTIIYSTFTSIYLWGVEALILWLLVYIISPISITLSDAIIIYFISSPLNIFIVGFFNSNFNLLIS